MTKKYFGVFIVFHYCMFSSYRWKKKACLFFCLHLRRRDPHRWTDCTGKGRRGGEENLEGLLQEQPGSSRQQWSSLCGEVDGWMEGWMGRWADVRFDLRNWELNGREPLKSLKFRCENRGAGKQHERENKKKPEINRS